MVDKVISLEDFKKTKEDLEQGTYGDDLAPLFVEPELIDFVVATMSAMQEQGSVDLKELSLAYMCMADIMQSVAEQMGIDLEEDEDNDLS